ncbi:MAG: hypothetical protein ACLQPD_00390 [Desulfomonilaceae bacterium]
MQFQDFSQIMGAPFRINKPSTFIPPTMPAPADTSSASAGPSSRSAPAATSRTSARRTKQGDVYFTRLVKLIPSEIVGLYLTFRETAASFLGIWAAICLILLLFIRTIGNSHKLESIQILAVSISSVSFILWVYAMGGDFLGIKFPDIPGAIPVSIGVWTFVVPYIYKGD